jgi:flagellar motor switch protein FliG
MNSQQSAIRRAAILVTELDHTMADALLAGLPEEQADLVRRAVLSLDDVDPRERDQVLSEFLQRPAPATAMDSGGVELDAGLAGRIAADRNEPEADGFGESSAFKPTAFRCLQHADAQVLAPLLRYEQPQTIAVVMAYLPREQAALLLAMFPAATQTAVVRRLADLDEMDAESLLEIERVLESLLSTHLRRKERRREGIEALAGILQVADPASQQTILAAIGDDAPAPRNRSEQSLAKPRAATKSRDEPAPFSFADLLQLDDDDLTTVVRTAEPELVTLALAAAGPDFRARVFGLLPPRAAKALQRELNHLGPTRLSDLEGACEELVRVARRLSEEDKIKNRRTRLSVAA